jgi:scyllo-inositol 2-dehydrogenase (NADP+)
MRPAPQLSQKPYIQIFYASLGRLPLHKSGNPNIQIPATTPTRLGEPNSYPNFKPNRSPRTISDMAPIRTAVLGYGLAGRVFHCPFVSAVPGLELVAIMQRTGNTAAEAYPSARTLRSPDEAFADPSIDLIIVGTPDATHFDFARQALAAGKHVVIDKPITTTSADARTLIDLARSTGKFMFPFQSRRYDGDFRTVRKLLRQGTLGRVVEIIAHYDRFRPMPKVGTWKEQGGNNGGLLFDLGSHLIDQVHALFGLPDRITGSVRKERTGTAIDDAYTVTLEYDHAGLAGGPLRYTCSSTMIAAIPAPRFAIHGTGGSFVKYGLDLQEPTIVAGTLPPPLGSPTPWLPEPESAWGTLTLAPNPAEPANLNVTKLPTELGDYRDLYADVRDAILGKAPPAIPAEDAFRTIRLLELAIQSSKERRTLDVSM